MPCILRGPFSTGRLERALLVLKRDIGLLHPCVHDCEDAARMLWQAQRPNCAVIALEPFDFDSDQACTGSATLPYRYTQLAVKLVGCSHLSHVLQATAWACCAAPARILCTNSWSACKCFSPMLIIVWYDNHHNVAIVGHDLLFHTWEPCAATVNSTTCAFGAHPGFLTALLLAVKGRICRTTAHVRHHSYC